MAKGWHKKNISTKWGIAIIGILFLSIILIVPFLEENQYIKSDASYYEDGICRSNTCLPTEKRIGACSVAPGKGKGGVNKLVLCIPYYKCRSNQCLSTERNVGSCSWIPGQGKGGKSHPVLCAPK